MKVLVVDDSKAMRMIVLTHLRKAGFGKHTFVEATNGAEGVKAVLSDLPDVILSDWNMPEMTGIQFITELNHLVASGKVTVMPKFIFVTSESTNEMRDQATAQGCAGYITKPFTVEAFENTLKDILN